MLGSMRRSTAITLVLLGGGAVGTAVWLENMGVDRVPGGGGGAYGVASSTAYTGTQNDQGKNVARPASEGKNTVTSSPGGFGARGFFSGWGS